MKNMKKILALLVAVLMIAASVSAFAAETYKITVTNTNTEHVTIAGKMYQAYKLFDATYSGSNVSYSISTSNHFYTTSGAKTELDKYFNFTASANDSTKMVVTLKTKVDSNGKNPGEEGYVTTYVFNDETARVLADKLEAYLPTSDDGHATVPAGAETVDIPLNGAGYYLVYGTADNKNGKDGDKEVVAALALTTAKPTATVNPKVDAPFLNKKMTKVEEGTTTVADAILDDAGKAAVAKVGSQVSYELTSAVPDLTGFSDYTYIMHDAISEGLTYDKTSFELTIDGTKVNIAPAFATGDKSFTLTIPYGTLAANSKGDEIKLTYKATVNENALTYDYENNTAYLTYSDSPYDNNTNDTPEKKTYVIDLNLDLVKVDATNTATKLDGAEFKLYKGDGTGNTYYKWDANDKKVTWVAKDDSDTFVTDNTGHFMQKIRGLDKGTYYLLETKAPEGYNLLASAIAVVISVEENTDGDKVTYSATFGGEGAAMTNEQVNIAASAHTADKQPLATGTIANSSGAELPSTGGIGTTLFYIGGGILVLAAVILLVTKRRMNAND